VIHGTADPLVPDAGGRATAAAIPGAQLLLIEGMGHSFPREVWPTIIDAIARHAAQAGA
jgi:pimeloyl-ACP methyl ester carboxylesterase